MFNFLMTIIRSLMMRRSKQRLKQQLKTTSLLMLQLAYRISRTILRKKTVKGITVKSLFRHFINVRSSVLTYILWNIVFRILSISPNCPHWISTVTCFICSIMDPKMQMKNSLTPISGMLRSHCDTTNRIMYKLFWSRSLASKFIWPRQLFESNFLKAVLFILVRLVTNTKMMKFCIDPLMTTMKMLNSKERQKAWMTVYAKQAIISGSTFHNSTAGFSKLVFMLVQRYLPTMVQIFSDTSIAKMSPQSLRVDWPRKRWYMQEGSKMVQCSCWKMQETTRVITEKKLMCLVRQIWKMDSRLLKMPRMSSRGMKTTILTTAQKEYSTHSQKQYQILSGLTKVAYIVPLSSWDSLLSPSILQCTGTQPSLRVLSCRNISAPSQSSTINLFVFVFYCNYQYIINIIMLLNALAPILNVIWPSSIAILFAYSYRSTGT